MTNSASTRRRYRPLFPLLTQPLAFSREEAQGTVYSLHFAVHPRSWAGHHTYTVTLTHYDETALGEGCYWWWNERAYPATGGPCQEVVAKAKVFRHRVLDVRGREASVLSEGD